MTIQRYLYHFRSRHNGIGFRTGALAIEIKKRSDALIKSEEKYRTILETIQDGCCDINKNELITYTNNAMQKITGIHARNYWAWTAKTSSMKKTKKWSQSHSKEPLIPVARL
jgi:PAS domain-containing protein